MSFGIRDRIKRLLNNEAMNMETEQPTYVPTGETPAVPPTWLDDESGSEAHQGGGGQANESGDSLWNTINPAVSEGANRELDNIAANKEKISTTPDNYGDPGQTRREAQAAAARRTAVRHGGRVQQRFNTGGGPRKRGNFS